jgi:hypothetical protein
LALEALEDRTVPSRFPGAGLLDAADSSGGSASAGAFPSTAHAFLAPHGVTASLQLDSGSGSTPTSIPYNGGTLLTHVRVQGVYYNDPTTLGFESQMDGFFTNIVQSPWVTQMLANFSVGSQTIGAGSFLGDDNTGLTFQGNGMIRSQLSSELANGKLAAPNGNTLYAVFVPSGGLGGFALGYHDAFVDPGSGKVIYYMVIDSFSFFDPNFSEFQGRTSVASHELSEAITDPGVGHPTPAHPGGDLGWSSPFAEIGDVSEGADQVTYHGYVMQQEWGRSPTDPPNLALGPVTAPADTDFAVTQINNPTEGTNNAVFASFTDKDGASELPSQFTVTVDWGDGRSSRSDEGSGNVTVTSNGDGTFNVVGRHTYPGEAGTTYGGHFPGRNFGITGASVFVSSGDEIARTTTPITLQEAGPLTNVRAHSFGSVTGQELTNQVVATFTDPGGPTGADPDTSEYQASINWGDNTPTDTNVTIVPIGNGHYAVLGNSHVYTSASGSPYQVSVTIAHDGTTNVVVGQATATVPTTFLVTSLLDDGSIGTLRWAVGQANTAAGLPTITFAPSLFGTPQTILLTGAPLELSNTNATEAVMGPATGVTVSGAGLSRVFQVDAGVSASLSGLTITGGKTAGNGAGLDNEGGITTLTDCFVSGNSAGGNGGGLRNSYGSATLSNCAVSGNSAQFGGGLDNDATVTLTNCTVSGNSAQWSGGGLHNTYGTATLRDCTVSGNAAKYGGGLDNYATATLTNCTVSGNSASLGGGLLNGSISFGSGYSYYSRSGTAALTNCTVSGNSAQSGGGVDNYATVTLTGCTVSGNNAINGGGLRNFGTAALTNCTISGNSAQRSGGGLYNRFGMAALTNCTISGNSAQSSTVGGGGLYNQQGAAALTNCTITGNSATYGGGLRNIYGTATLTNCTVSGNSASLGGGLRVRGGTTTLNNTIVAGNTRPSSGRANDVSGSVGGTNNLIGAGGSGGLVNGVNGNQVGVANALLAPLGNYGGPTQTIPLLPGSPALDAGTSTGAPATDQRGQCRVGDVDIGAFESQGFTFAVVPGGTPQTANIGTTFANPLAINVTANNPVEPVDGGVFTFVAAPAANGATAIFLNSSAAITNGQAAATAAPNNVGGSYTVVASLRGFSTQFSLTNAGPVFAALVVSTTSDALAPGTGLLSLREAIGFANTDPQGNSNITFSSNVFSSPRTIALTGLQLELSKTNGTESITGPAAGVTVSGGGLSRVLQVDAGVTASLSGLTITRGKTAGTGGGLYNLGTAALTDCTVSGNSASTQGGGLMSRGTASLTDCTVSGNSASFGGGVYGARGATALTNCTVSGNSALGLGQGGGGGGLAFLANTTTLTNCTISGNSSLGTYGSGGGLQPAYGTTALTNCTISGNSAPYNGGGLANYGDSTSLMNCTISGNSSSLFGGGLGANSGTTALTNCTVSGNSAGFGGGVYNRSSSAGGVAVGNTIVAGNTASTSGPDAVGTITSLGHNLIGATDGSTGWVGSDRTGTAAAPLIPLLAPPGNYGGPTQTMPLLPGSPAIDAGSSTAAPALDQRGQGRVGAVDIGAFESQGFTLAGTSGGGQSTDISTAFTAPLVVTVTANNPGEPVAGGRVTFTPPASGASATLSGSPATISAAGTASVTATANGSAGRYTVSATASGITTPASFGLANRPTITVPSAQTAYQNVDQPISGIVIGDAPGATLTVTLSVSHGTLTLGTTTGLTMVAGNGTVSVTLTGTVADLNAALASLVYRGGHNYSGGDTLRLTATDSGVSATPARVALAVESITQEAANLRAQVTALRNAGVLSPLQALVLNFWLDLQGNDLDILRVEGFLLTVNLYRQLGMLTPAQAGALLGPANTLLLSVTRR